MISRARFEARIRDFVEGQKQVTSRRTHWDSLTQEPITEADVASEGCASVRRPLKYLTRYAEWLNPAPIPGRMHRGSQPLLPGIRSHPAVTVRVLTNAFA
jgi:hypothetical protein